MREFTFSMLIFAFLFSFSQIKALACVCVDMGDSLEQKISWQLKNAQSVFLGKLTEIDEGTERGDRLIKFQVEKFWKGTLSEEIVVATEGETSSCAYPFEKDKRYLIFVHTYNGKSFTGSCLPNREISRAAEELKILGNGAKPKNKLKSKQN